jgi:hypothetical protein
MIGPNPVPFTGRATRWETSTVVREKESMDAQHWILWDGG